MNGENVLFDQYAPKRRERAIFVFPRAKILAFGILSFIFAHNPLPAFAQSPDCARLLQQIAAAGRGSDGRGASAARRQQAELAKTSSYAHAIGCDRTQFLFFGGNRPPQCDAINAQIAQMQANVSALQHGASGDGLKRQLQNQYDAICRPRPNRGLLETIFGNDDRPPPLPDRYEPPRSNSEDRRRDTDEASDDAEESVNEHGVRTYGGHYAICVRSCDGGYFPVSYSAQPSSLQDLQQLCTALCPNTEAKLYTRRGMNGDMKVAVAAEGGVYADHPNAFKFEKLFESNCTCRPPDKSWSEALADAEKLLGQGRKGDILVTPEKADELSRPTQPSDKPQNNRKHSGKDAARFDPLATARILEDKKTADEAITQLPR